MINDRSERILIVAPTGRDAELMCTHLSASGLDCLACRNLIELSKCVRDGTGAIVITEEALGSDGIRALSHVLTQQPAWSEIPLIVLTGDATFSAKSRTFEGLESRTNITLIDRPVRIKALVSAAQSALRARRRQYEVRDLMAQLEDRVHERDKFLAILGHELRNPLSAILLASQMTDDDGKLDNEHARLIERQSRHLTQLVNDLLDLSRVVTGKIVLKPQVVDLRDIVRQSLKTLQAAADAQKLTLQADLPADPVRIHADPVRVEQIVANLLTNAIKYTPPGGHIAVRVAGTASEVRLEVKDDGVGIASDRIDRIFEMFAQLDNAIGQAQGGMGIGLALVRNLVELHGGSVEAQSDGVGKGSEFVVRFPPAAAEAFSEVPATPAEPFLEQSGTRRIVIVEDNDDVRDLLRLKLRRLGHEVTGVGDGEAGLREIIDHRPDLALVDLGLPGLDGFEIARRAREEVGKDIVLVAVSGFGQPDDKRRALEAGFDEHITKPADVRDIETLLVRFPPRNSSSDAVL